MKVLLLGVGMQGKAALHDLVKSEAVGEVVAADREVEALRQHVQRMGYGDAVRCEQVDATDAGDLDRLMGTRPDVVVDLLPVPFIGAVASAAIRAGIHLVNTFYVVPELGALAAEADRRGVTILPEFGLDPGIDLVLLAEAVRSLDEVEEISTYGAGIPEPEAADNPLKYKVSWTFEGVLKAYRRSGRVVRDSKVVTVGETEMFAPENVHEVEIEGLGKLEAYPNGDVVDYLDALGVKSADLRGAGRYALRWPGHSAFWKALVDLELLDEKPVVVDGVPVDRRRFLSAVIEPNIGYGPDERDLAILRVAVEGKKAGQPTRSLYEIVDRRDLETGIFAMGRTVGYTASIGAQMIASGQISKRGLLSPVTDVPYDPFVGELAKRGIDLRTKQTPITR